MKHICNRFPLLNSMATLFTFVLVLIQPFLSAFGQIKPLVPASHYSYKHLYGFCRSSTCNDGAEPNGDLVFDAAGNLYGTSEGGGSSACQAIGCGTVFQLSPKAGGGWKHTVLFRFGHGSGSNPPAGLAMDAAGNLYGTTITYPDPGGVFRLSPNSNGGWTFTKLFTFNGTNGAGPYGRLMLDAAGNVYGTTQSGGDFNACPFEGCGTVFRLSPQKNGTWKHTTLFSFNAKDGLNPVAGVILDASGNLYGTTELGGSSAGCVNGCGTVFRLSPSAHGHWKITTLHNFDGADGSDPEARPTFDTAGNLYGTTASGGQDGFGTVFQLSPQKSGHWKLATLATFDITNGANPVDNLIFDPAGNLYGTTEADGSFGIGIVFRLSPEKNGMWKLTTLLTFTGDSGSVPNGGLVLDSAGNLYGATPVGGKHSAGVAFELSPKN